jgi:predicted ATPase
MSHPQASHRSQWTTGHAERANAQIEFRFDELLMILSSAHPMRVRQSLQGIKSLAIREVTPVENSHHALRLVYFIDKIYDNDVDLFVSAAMPLAELFQHRYFHGGDTKKFLRALSRLQELTIE